jgi:hypothetical protein
LAVFEIFVLFVSNWRYAPGSGAGLLVNLGGLGVLVVNTAYRP